jgi:hypothetical protein
MITSNKFLRASYGEPLRRFLAKEANLQQMVDFGHAPIFEDADTFPCIAVLRGGASHRQPTEAQICPFPREVLGQADLETYVQEHGYPVPQSRFGAGPWSLERPEVDELMDKIRRAGVPLSEFVGEKPYRGILTGFNQAYLIDTLTKDQLVQQDPDCAEIIRPYLRGQDIKRWAPDWAGLWMILLKSSENQTWPWSDAGERAEEIFARAFPSLYQHLKPFEARLSKRWDKGRYWWELRSCAYHKAFEQPKIAYQEIQFHPAYSFDDQTFLTNNKVFILPCADRYVLAVFNSPLIWWYNWRYLPHMKDEALSPKGELMETLPIAPPTDALRAKVEPSVQRLVALTRMQQQATATVLDWLRVEFDVAKPGQRLEAFAALDEDAFVKEVSRRRPHSADRLTPAGVGALRAAFAEHALPLRTDRAEMQRLEQRLAGLISAAYGLTPEEVDLLWRTAPPRMPIETPAG